MKRYDEYKQTGTPWIGEIPSHWECKQFRYAIKHITTGLNPRSNFVLGEGNNYYVTIRNFENGKLNLDSECDNINDAHILKTFLFSIVFTCAGVNTPCRA